MRIKFVGGDHHTVASRAGLATRNQHLALVRGGSKMHPRPLATGEQAQTVAARCLICDHCSVTRCPWEWGTGQGLSWV